VRGDLFQHAGGLTDERGGAGPEQWRLLDMPPGDGQHEPETSPGRDHECQQLEREGRVCTADAGRDQRRHRDDAERERGGQQFGDAERRRHDQPDDPRHQGRSAALGPMRHPPHAGQAWAATLMPLLPG
jgi:hypothetical protein